MAAQGVPAPSTGVTASPSSINMSNVNAAVAPTFADAGSTADNQKAALLQAIAQAGSAGAQQFQAQQQQSDQDRQNALQAAAQREAVVQNMPPELAAQLGAKISAPFNFGDTVAQQSNQSFQNQMTAEQGAGANYLTELKAGIPVVEADVASKVAALQAAAQAKAAQDAQAQAIANTQLATENARLQQVQETNGTTGLGKLNSTEIQLLGTNLQDAYTKWQQGQAAVGALAHNSSAGKDDSSFWQAQADQYNQTHPGANVSPADLQSIAQIGGTKTAIGQQRLNAGQVTFQIDTQKLNAAIAASHNPQVGAKDPRVGNVSADVSASLDGVIARGGTIDASTIANLTNALMQKYQNPPIDPLTISYAIDQYLSPYKSAASSGV